MRYDTPELREKLAAEYVLGTMPPLVRRRFERLLAADSELRRAVEDWNARFDPIDRDAAPREPPSRVWRAVERQLGLPPARAPSAPNWSASPAFWRGTALAAAAVAAVALVYVAVHPGAPPNVVAILSNDKGEPGWVALGGGRGGEVAVAPLHSVAIDVAHTFELWVIAEGKPRPLGLLAPDPAHPLTVAAAQVPAGGVLAVSLEPAGGSPTGLPTGPVQFKGAVLPRRP